VADSLVDRPAAAVPRDDAVPAAQKTRDHVPAHAAEAVETDLHFVPSFSRSTRPRFATAAPRRLAPLDH
jgi:hypothetical protein